MEIFIWKVICVKLYIKYNYKKERERFSLFFYIILDDGRKYY